MRHKRKMMRVVGRRIEGGRMMKRKTWRARIRRMRRSKYVLGFEGLKIDERTS